MPTDTYDRLAHAHGPELRAIIFDMDGLLIDSEPLWVRAEIEVFASVGFAIREEDCARTKGLRVDDVVGYWYARGAWQGTPASDVVTRLVTRVAELVGSEGQPLPGAAHALAVARANGRGTALASSSPHVIIDAALGRLGLRHAFDIVQSAEHEPLGKPHPGVFLRTCARLGVNATQCLVVEDSLTGVIAAKAARMACIAVPFDYPRHDPRFVVADATLASLTQLSPELLTAIEQAR